MITAVILICAIGVGDCTEQDAIEVMRVPNHFETIIQCLVQSEAFLANQAQMRGPPEGRLVIVCKGGELNGNT